MRKVTFAIVISGLLLNACMFKSSTLDKSEIELARVEDKIISAAELDSLAPIAGAVITDTTDEQALKLKLLDRLIDGKIAELLKDSVAVTLDSDLDFAESRNKEVSNTVFRMMFEGEVSARVQIDSAEVLQHYEENKERYKTPEQIKASHILIPSPPPDTADIKSDEEKASIIEKNDKETYERALAVYNEATSGGNWDSLVVKYSQDATTNKKGGDLGYFGRGRMVAPFDSAAFAAQVDDIVGPVKTRYGYHIIKITDRKSEEYRELDQDLWSQIQTQLKNAKEKEMADQFLDSLKAEANYMFNEDVLVQEDSLVDPDIWVMVVNETDTVYEQRVQRDFPKYRRFYQIDEWTVDDKINMLKEISTTYLLRAAGKSLGYYDKPKAMETKNEFTSREAGMRAQNMLRDLEYKPTDEEIEAYYDENFEEKYKEKKPVHVQHIIFEDQSLAAAIRDSLVAGADFKEMALKYYPGEPEIREVAFDLGYISEEELGQEFFDYVKNLEVGEISEPFKTEWGYHVVKLVNKRADKKLDQVRPGIRKALMDAADDVIKRAYLDEKRKTISIIMNDDAVKEYKFPESLYSTQINP